MDRLAPVVALIAVAAAALLALREGGSDPEPAASGPPAAGAPSDTGRAGGGAATAAASARGRGTASAPGYRGAGGAPPATGEPSTTGEPAAADPGGGEGSAPGPDVSVERRRYAVSGSTARELRASLREHGRRMEGRIAFAWTDWSVDVGYDYRRADGECRIVRPDVDVRIVVTLPEWRGRSGATVDLVSRWRRDLATMEEHEEGHVALARRAGRRVDSALRRMEPAPCALLRDRADAAADDVLREARRAQDAYDERTDHGGEQRAAGLRP